MRKDITCKESLNSPYHECSLDAYEPLDDNLKTKKNLRTFVTIVDIEDKLQTPAPALENKCDISEVCVVVCALFGYRANTESLDFL